MSDVSILADYPVLQYALAIGTVAAAIYGAWRGEMGARRARAMAQQVPDETQTYWGGPNAKMLELLQSIDATLKGQREDSNRVANDLRASQNTQNEILRDIRERSDRR